MIYWSLIRDFDSACKIIKYMSYPEYEYIHHTNKNVISVECEKPVGIVELLKAAAKHYSDLMKLQAVSYKKYKKIPNVELRELEGSEGFIEYWLVKSDKPKKKICGYPLRGLPKGWRCTLIAGRGTNHRNYGYCRKHEGLMNNDERKEFWLKMRQMGKVKTLGEVYERAEQIERVALESIDADLSFIEIARQALLKKAENDGELDRNMRLDLTVMSDVSAKLKKAKISLEKMNWIPPDQVASMILQVLDAVTKNEDESVRKRIADRAMGLTNIIVPQIRESNPEITPIERKRSIEDALDKAENYVDAYGQIDWGGDEGTAGFKTPKPEPNYRKHHPILKRKMKEAEERGDS
jgi:hypothetical protein